MANTREKEYRKFGPQQMEILALVVMDEINVLRVLHGEVPRTKQQILNAMEAKWAEVPVYDWMDQD